MHLSTRGRYAVMAMLDLATLEQEFDKPVSLAQIADRQELSLSYLEQLFARLRRAGLVTSVRGPGGGYRLAKLSKKTYLDEIISAVNEETDVTRCKSHSGEGKGCVKGEQCNAHDIWTALGSHIALFMGSVNLEMVLDGKVCSDYVPDVLAAGSSSVKVQVV